MNWKLTSFEKNLTQEESGLYPGSDKLCTNTKASSEYIFSRAHPYVKQLCTLQNQEII